MGFQNRIKLNQSSVSDIPKMYTEMETERSDYLTRGRDYSKMTLPYLLPETTGRSGAANQHPFQSLGAQLVNHLSNKIVITMFPPQRSFFKADLSDEAKKTLMDSGMSAVDLTSQLAAIEEKCIKVQSKIAARVALTEATKHLIVSGNVLLKLPIKGKGKLRAIPLSRYVVKRDLDDQLTELIILDEKTLEGFEPKIRAAILATPKGKNLKPKDKINLYTRVSLKADGMYEVTQSANEIPVGEMSRLKPDRLPWIVLRWNSCYGEAYGRGLVEDHVGDFYVMEFLSEARAKGMALMADIKYLVKPGGITDINHLISSPSGEYIAGHLDDIGVLQIAKYADYTPITEALKDYERRLGQGFLMNSANRRDAERVTTYELRLDANELETSLGGIYSLLAETLQVPFAMLLMVMVNAKLGTGIISPSILTGLEALGRVGDMEKIAQFSEMMQMPASWPEGVQKRVKWGDFSKTVSAAISLDTPWLMTDEEANAQAEAESQAAMTNMAMQEGSKAIPEVIKQQMQPEEGAQ